MLDLISNIGMLLASRNAICEDELKQVWNLIGTIVFWIQIAIPVILVLLGTIDLAKAVLAGDDKKVKESQNAFIKRLIYGAAVFFVIFIVQLVFGAIADADPDNNGCFTCVSQRGNC